jgi:hypothetical protein
MRLLGQVEVVRFLRVHPEEVEVLGAWVNELRHRQWRSADALMADYRSARAHDPPDAMFRLGPTPVFVEALVDYRNGVVLIAHLSITEPSAKPTQ